MMSGFRFLGRSFTPLLVICSFSYTRPGPLTELSCQPWTELVEHLLQPGDVVFRRGSGMFSAAVLVSENPKRYSHVGVFLRVNSAARVIHCVVDEPFGDLRGGVHLDTLREFISTDRAEALGIYRPRKSRPGFAEELTRIAMNYTHREITFDGEFDLESNDRLYCTEFVWKLFFEAGIDLLSGIELPKISFGLSQRRVILPSTLIQSGALTYVWESPQESDQAK